MLTLIKTTYNGFTAVLAASPGVTRGKFNEWIQNSYAVALLHWHEKMRPRHFQDIGKVEYGYQPRKADYEEDKREAVGHTRPLTMTGESERATKNLIIRTTSKSGRLSMNAGNLAFTPLNRKRSMRDELTATTDAEEKELASIIDLDMQRQMSGDRSILTRRTG